MGTKRTEIASTDEANKAREAAYEFLRPVIEGTRDVYGSRIKLAELLSQEAGEPVSRHLVIRWLRDDISTFQQPHLGIALLLRKVFQANRKTICQPWDPANRRRPRGSAKRTKKTNAKKTT